MNTLGGGVRTLIILTGQILNGESGFVTADQKLFGYKVYLWLGQNKARCLCKFFFSEPIHIVALNDADVFEVLNVQIVPKVVKKFTGLGIEFGLFLDKNAVHSWKAAY